MKDPFSNLSVGSFLGKTFSGHCFVYLIHLFGADDLEFPALVFSLFRCDEHFNLVRRDLASFSSHIEPPDALGFALWEGVQLDGTISEHETGLTRLRRNC